MPRSARALAVSRVIAHGKSAAGSLGGGLGVLLAIWGVNLLDGNRWRCRHPTLVESDAFKSTTTCWDSRWCHPGGGCAADWRRRCRRPGRN